jgi:hypothetical protein
MFAGPLALYRYVVALTRAFFAKWEVAKLAEPGGICSTSPDVWI